MNLGKDTIDELFIALEKETTNAELQRALLRYEIKGWDDTLTSPKIIAKAIPYIHSTLNGTNEMDAFVQHVLNIIDSNHNKPYDTFKDLSEVYPTLSNTLLRDGYKVEKYKLNRTIPKELETAKVPDELLTNLKFYSLNTSIGHLEQAQKNYKDGNWASANAMIRSFFESVLLFIDTKMTSPPNATSGGIAIDRLTSVGFFREDLNEADKQRQALGFIGGLWKMLHPHGSHPGLSEEEDSTFRYHITLVTINYYLKRLRKVI